METTSGTAMLSCSLCGLPPVTAESPRVLILGSFPSTKSLQHSEYYGNPQNHFWKIVEALFSIDQDLLYPDRTNRLIQHPVALWDVVRSCRREGSADDRIREPLFNDIAGFLAKNPTLQLIALNGTSAGRYYRRLQIPIKIKSVVLPSTSPANTRFTIAEKVREWKIVRLCARGE
jgi:TDG/mug DNA glycosylase family protein